MYQFVYQQFPMRVRFEPVTPDLLISELGLLEASRVVVLSTPEQSGSAGQIVQMLGAMNVGIFTKATMHTPVEISEEAAAWVKERRADVLVAFGGGSTIGLSKAIAKRTGLPQLVLPTTYAGSEMTPILGETSQGNKKTIADPRLLPNTVIYDASLTFGLPRRMTFASSLNALAHAAEALYAKDTNPIIAMIAKESARALALALREMETDLDSRKARSAAQYGAWLSGICLGSAGMALHHKLCHVLGGMFNLPHAELHAILLPHVLAFNLIKAPQAATALREALNSPDPAKCLYDLGEAGGLGGGLRSLGMPESGIGAAADAALLAEYWNPRVSTKQDILRIISAAFEGGTPNQSENQA